MTLVISFRYVVAGVDIKQTIPERNDDHQDIIIVSKGNLIGPLLVWLQHCLAQN